MNLEGKTAVVTGVSRGIGLATVRALLERGVKVSGWGRTNNDIQDPNYMFVHTDVRNLDQVANAFNKTTANFGQVDILINNAGLGYFKKLDHMPFELWKEMFDTNVHGIFFCTKAVLTGMKERQSGHIINISSIAGLEGIPEAVGYCGTKHAVRGISHALFKEVRKKGIKVTCIYPGSVETRFFDHYDFVTPNETMMQGADIAKAIVDVLESADNVVPLDLELRPINPRYS
jgi:NADP-dependent 3-hydroxy acid dehydrogenase YdfG